MVKQMRAAEAAQYVRTRLDLWQAMHRSGWYLPKLTGAITLAYIEAVRAGQVWCPKYEQVRIRPCLVPPATKVLLRWIEEALRIQQAYNPTRPVRLGFNQSRLPDSQWALHALATLEPNHRIFGKGYVGEPAPLFQGQIPSAPRPMVNNSDGLFDGLPVRRGKLAKRTMIKKIQPSIEARIERMRARRVQLEA